VIVSPLQGSVLVIAITQGFGCFAAFTLGCAAKRIQRLKDTSLSLWRRSHINAGLFLPVVKPDEIAPHPAACLIINNNFEYLSSIFYWNCS
jgi:hypothetical protein